MAIDPFSRRALTPDQWRAKAQKIQSELEGLTIHELLRGGVGAPKRDASTVPIVEDMTQISGASPLVTPTAGSGRTKQARMRVVESTIHASSQTSRWTIFGFLVRTMRPISSTIGTPGISTSNIHFRPR